MLLCNFIVFYDLLYYFTVCYDSLCHIIFLFMACYVPFLEGGEEGDFMTYIYIYICYFMPYYRMTRHTILSSFFRLHILYKYRNFFIQFLFHHFIKKLNINFCYFNSFFCPKIFRQYLWGAQRILSLEKTIIYHKERVREGGRILVWREICACGEKGYVHTTTMYT